MSETLGRSARVLIADDEPEIRSVLAELLQKSYDCEAVGSGEAALERLGRREFDLVISDIMMGGMTGLDLIPHVRRLRPDAVVVMISGVQTVESAIGALRAGAFDYVMKPFDLEHVEAAVVRALEHQSLRASKRRYENYLEEMVAQRTAELDRALHSLADAYRTTLKALTAALETRDAETHGHSERVVNFSLRLGRELGLDAERLRSLEFGSLLHDIGKIGVPDAILRKPAKLTEGEWIKMREHPLHGQRILLGIEFLEGAARVVAQHHERWDGSGYPAGLRGEQIDINARIFSVADAFDAMVSDRVYRRGRPYEEAAEELERFSGSQFDPAVVGAFHRVPREEWDEIRRRSVEMGEPKQEAAGRLEAVAHGLLIEPDSDALVN
ncbi:MAG TPA: HD domain-containing phosphohydrolase [Pyrinomonadaceae bacterium]|jgi:response regulator RpfG family c-di-GMP phosphodiesterase|nr:HD domain-containing phosphohydrolase [Pyrinomonadaceae bacterium]